jgi:hypothetical protein
MVEYENNTLSPEMKEAGMEARLFHQRGNEFSIYCILAFGFENANTAPVDKKCGAFVECTKECSQE